MSNWCGVIGSFCPRQQPALDGANDVEFGFHAPRDRAP
jgi:hypothetical protein